MLTIKTPATSGNVGVGFDTLGLSYKLYNVFTFELSETYQASGFKEGFNDQENLVIKAYLAFAKDQAKPVKVTLVENNIPMSRGLGSSASCILAGVLAANELCKLKQTFKQCVSFAADMEGHGDNVFPCAYGGLTACLKTGDTYIYKTFDIHPSIRFYAYIPNVASATKSMRDLLPQKIDRRDAHFNLSRMIFVPDAFKLCDIKLLKTLLKDKLHEPYRYQTIPDQEVFEDLKARDDVITLISGSGTTMLFISDKALVIKQLKDDAQFIELNISEGIEVSLT